MASARESEASRPPPARMGKTHLQYVDSLRQYGDADFSEPSRHITGLLEADEARSRRISFGMALYVRRIYTYFFDHLL